MRCHVMSCGGGLMSFHLHFYYFQASRLPGFQASRPGQGANGTRNEEREEMRNATRLDSTRLDTPHATRGEERRAKVQRSKKFISESVSVLECQASSHYAPLSPPLSQTRSAPTSPFTFTSRDERHVGRFRALDPPRMTLSFAGTSASAGWVEGRHSFLY